MLRDDASMSLNHDASSVTAPAKEIAATESSSLWAGRRRYVALLLFFNLLINYMNRTTFSVAAPTIAREFNWDPQTLGLIFSSFMGAYCLCLIPWGLLSDRIGPHKVNTYSVLIWSISAMLTGAVTGFGTMLPAQLVLGAGESASLPTAGKVVRQWFPAGERGLATAIFNAGTFAGPAISAPVAAWLVMHLGWRLAFVIIGSLGFVWLAFWFNLYQTPADCSWLQESEKKYLMTAITGPTATTGRPEAVLGKLLRRQTVWGLLLTQGCCAYTLYLFLFWLPSYLVQARHMQLMRASWFTSAPYLVAAVLGIFIGRLSDRALTAEGLSQGKRRKLLTVFILLSSVVLGTTLAHNEYIAAVLISISLTCISSALTLNIAMSNDLVWSGQVAGTVLGIVILGGNSFGLIAPILTGYIIKKTGSFDSAFYLAGGLLVVGALTASRMTRAPVRLDEG
jgi:sugar phosphate permease